MLKKLFDAAMQYLGKLKAINAQEIIDEVQAKADEIGVHFEKALAEGKEVIAPATEAAEDFNAVCVIVWNALQKIGFDSRGADKPVEQMVSADDLYSAVANQV